MLCGNICWNFEEKIMHENMDTPPEKPNFDVIAVPTVNWNMNEKFKEWCREVDAETRSSGYYDVKCRCDNCQGFLKVFLSRGRRLDTAIKKCQVSCPHCDCFIAKKIEVRE
jgi:hypothetical protein